MPKFPTYFRADEEAEPSKDSSPSPNEWFGQGKSTWHSGSPTISEDTEENESYDGWREFQQGHPRDPMGNELLNDESQNRAIQFRNSAADPRSLIYFLEQAAEIFEAEGHTDLAAECEHLCEMFSGDPNA